MGLCLAKFWDEPLSIETKLKQISQYFWNLFSGTYFNHNFLFPSNCISNDLRWRVSETLWRVASNMYHMCFSPGSPVFLASSQNVKQCTVVCDDHALDPAIGVTLVK